MKELLADCLVTDQGKDTWGFRNLCIDSKFPFSLSAVADSLLRPHYKPQLHKFNEFLKVLQGMRPEERRRQLEAKRDEAKELRAVGQAASIHAMPDHLLRIVRFGWSVLGIPEEI